MYCQNLLQPLTIQQMKTAITTLLLFFICALGWAQINVGYCQNEIKSSIYNSSTTATISCAMALTATELAEYQTCNIKELQIGLYNAQNLASITVWARHHLADANLVEFQVDLTENSIINGWNTFTLTNEITISEIDTLYVGYDYTQTVKNSKIVGASGKKNTPNSCWQAVNGKWKDSKTNNLPHCIRVGLSGTEPNLIKLQSLQLYPRYQDIVEGTKPLHISGTLLSMGKDPLTQFELTWKDGATESHQQFSCNAQFGNTVNFEAELMPTQVNQLNAQLQMCVVNPNGTQTSDDCNSRTLYYELMDNNSQYLPSLLVEQYTSLNNGFSTYGMQQVREALTNFSLIHDNQVEIITLHQGYGPADALRITANSDYSASAIFGPEALSFAPAISINREQVLSSTLPTDSLFNAFQIGLNKVAHSRATAQAIYDEATNNLAVKYEIEANAFTWCKNPVIMMLLVQNQVQTSERQRNYYEDIPCLEENTVCQYLTPASGLPCLQSSNGTSMTTTELNAIENGTIPTFTGSTLSGEISSTVAVTDFNPTNYHIVLYICNMDGDNRVIDSVSTCKIEY